MPRNQYLTSTLACSHKATGGAARSEREHSEALILAHSVAAARAAVACRLRAPLHSSRARRRAEDRRGAGRCCRCLYAAYRRCGCWAVGWQKGSRIGAVLGWDGMGWVQRRQWGMSAAHAARAGGAGTVPRRARGQDESGVGDREQLHRVLLRTVVHLPLSRRWGGAEDGQAHGTRGERGVRGGTAAAGAGDVGVIFGMRPATRAVRARHTYQDGRAAQGHDEGSVGDDNRECVGVLRRGGTSRVRDDSLLGIWMRTTSSAAQGVGGAHASSVTEGRRIDTRSAQAEEERGTADQEQPPRALSRPVVVGW
ncbi:hypothetical protein B0H14DRAFT_3133156 [Mycena olivaceomarginata]|nr:hypothetical protein B0H14DRAFT_3133156 [Mycena olivaceomarginata]